MQHVSTLQSPISVVELVHCTFREQYTYYAVYFVYYDNPDSRLAFT